MDLRPVVGMDIGGTKTLLAVVDPAGMILGRLRIDTPQTGRPADDVVRLARYVGEVLAAAGIASGDARALGAGAPGPLDPHAGIVFEPPNLAGWHNVPLGAMLAEATGLRTVIENDANAAALGEAWIGAGAGVRDLIYIVVGTGVGGGLILGGELYQGASGTAGEIGHMTVDPDGPVCGCGRRGHLEALAAGPAIARMAVEEIRAGRASSLAATAAGYEDSPPVLTTEEVAAAAAQGDPLAREVFDRAGTFLGIAVASLVNLLNPALVVIGGGVSKAGDLLLGPVRRTVQTEAFEQPGAAVRIVPAALGDDAGVIGAAAVALRRIK